MNALALTERQMQVLVALCDTFIPSIDMPEDPDSFWGRSGSDLDLPQHVTTVIAMQSPEQQAQFVQLLNLLASPLAGIGGRGPFRPFDKLTLPERTTLLNRWAFSSVALLRQGFQALKRVIGFLNYGISTEQGNPNWPAIGYPGPRSAPPVVPRTIRPLSWDTDTTLSCDTVVVGSGAGGGVVAGELAAAGQDVIVVEKGRYLAENSFTQREAEMTAALYEAGGTLSTKDLGIGVLAGSCLGGGTTVNWAGAFRTPGYILEEWARAHLLPHLLTPAYQQSLDAVESTLHVDTDESHRNAQNQALWDGATRRDIHIKAVPRNVEGCDSRDCGYCCFGCQRGAKRSTLKSYLQVAHDAGARILVESTVQQVLIEQGKAVGVLVRHRRNGREVNLTIRAKRVVVAAGAIHTPALLRRSGLNHPHIGRHLYLHPTVAVGAFYEQKMEGWNGVIMSAVSDEWTRLDGGYGFKLETPPIHPGLAALVLPWISGQQHKALMRRLAHLATFIVIVRDREGGRVTLDKRGQPVLHYTLSGYDLHHLWRGIAEAARVHERAGAETILMPHGRGRDHETRNGPNQLETMLRDMRHWGWKPNQFPLMSAHQMGTCRMGGDAQRHPLTPENETREVRNLFVTDASAFPSSSGANPMLSIQTLAHYAAQGIKARS